MHSPQPIAETLRRDFGAFVLERYPFAATSAHESLAAVTGVVPILESGIDRLRDPFAREFRTRLQRLAPIDLSEPTPGVSAAQRFEQALDEIVSACDGFLCRAAIRTSLTPDERLEILRGMLITRATDNRLKAFFTNGEVRYGESAFQGKGFVRSARRRSTRAAIRLRRGDDYRAAAERVDRDVVAPLIRDLGVTLAMRPEPETSRAWCCTHRWARPVRRWTERICMSATCSRASCRRPRRSATGTGHDRRASPWRSHARQSGRVALSFIGEGGSSLGEWHEAINLCAAAPAAGGVLRPEQPDGAIDAGRGPIRGARVRRQGGRLRDPRHHARRNRSRRNRGGVRMGGRARARRPRARRSSNSIAMRMCGHAHHDDMLYLGKEPPPSWEYPPLTATGLRGPRAVRILGRARSDSRRMRRGSRPRADRRRAASKQLKREAERRRGASEAGRRSRLADVGERPASACSRRSPRRRVEVLDPASCDRPATRTAAAARAAGRRSINERTDVSRSASCSASVTRSG